MFKLIFRFGILLIIIAGMAAAGITFNEKNIENGALQTIVSAWNSVATGVHGFVVDNDEQIKDISKKAASKAADLAVDSISNVGEFVKENKDEIREATEKAAETVTNSITEGNGGR